MERKTCTTRIGVVKNRQFVGACTIIALSIFVIVERDRLTVSFCHRFERESRNSHDARVRVIIRSSGR